MVKTNKEKKLSKSTSFTNTKIPQHKLKQVVDAFLKQIKQEIDKIKLNKNKKYSLLSCVFLCFYEKKRGIIYKKELYDFIKKEINKNENKIITSCDHIKNSDKSIVTQYNYYHKLNYIFKTNRRFLKVRNMESKEGYQIELNYEYIKKHKENLFIKIFGYGLNGEKSKTPTKTTKSPTIKKRKFQKCLTSKNNNKINSEVKEINKEEKEVEKEEEEKEEEEEEKYEEEKDEEKKKEKQQKKENLFNVVKVSKNKKVKIAPKNTSVRKGNNMKKIHFFSANIELSEFEKNEPKYLNKKRKSKLVATKTNSNHKYLVRPKFVDVSYSNKLNTISNQKNSSDNNSETTSTSNKELSYINKAGNQFVLNLKAPRLVNALKNGDNYIKINGKILFDIKDEPIIQDLLNAAMGEYFKFCEYIEYFMGNKNILSDSEEDDNINKNLAHNKNNKKSIAENFKIKKKRCYFLINKIITRLTQYLAEYEFLVEIIKDLYNHENNIHPLKELLNMIDRNINILCKENIFHLENILKTEFDNASNFFMINYGITNKV